MTLNVITQNHLEACQELNNLESYQAFVGEINALVKHHQPTPAALQQQFADTSDADKQAQALLCLTSLQNPPAFDESSFAHQVFHAQTNTRLLAAAALYLVTQKKLNIAYLETLFLSASPFLPSAVSVENEYPNSTLSRDARYFFLKALGFRQHPDFIHLLYQILTRQYHFYPQYLAAEILENLGESLDEEDIIYYNRSISVDALSDYISITDDDKYTGTSNCPDCRFFPCKITHYYAGGIQDCSLWNKTDPNTVDNIIDRRTWGNVQSEQNVASTDMSTVKKIWLQARQCLEKKQHQQAIPLLCKTLLLAEQQAQDSSITPLAWLYLAHCFKHDSNPLLTFIAMREASQQSGLIPDDKIAERNKVQNFDARPTTVLKQEINAWQQELQAVDYKKQNNWVSALHCCLKVNIAEAGKHGGNWFEIGECLQALDQLHLAELFMHQGVVRAAEQHLVNKFLQAEQHVHRLLEKP